MVIPFQFSRDLHFEKVNQLLESHTSLDQFDAQAVTCAQSYLEGPPLSIDLTG